MAIGPVHLADKSAWEQARYDRRARDRLHELRAAGRLAVCVVSMAELLFSARNADELNRIRLDLSALPYMHITADAERHVVETMTALAACGQHRTPIPDLMVAAIARVGSAVVLHYDSDYERIAAVTGQPHEWIVPRGTGHGMQPPDAGSQSPR
ncbi:MAG: PIN domain-containing protein [Pseudonocardiaceae bacterium]